MDPLVFAVLVCTVEFITSLFLIRLLVRTNRHGYVTGSLLLTIVPSLLLIRVFGAVALAYFARDFAQKVVLALFGAFGAGAVGGVLLGRAANTRETHSSDRK